MEAVGQSILLLGQQNGYSCWVDAKCFTLLSNDSGDPEVVGGADRRRELRTAYIRGLTARGLGGQSRPVELEQKLAGSQEALELCRRRLTAACVRLDASCIRVRGLRARAEDLEAKLTVALAKAAEGLCTWYEIPVGGYYVSPNDGKLRMKLRTESAMAGSSRQFHDLHGADDSGLNTVWGAGVGCDPNARIWRRC